MNKNFIIYDSYTITFNDLKERSIVKQYYMLDENDQILKIICDQTKNSNIDGAHEIICGLHCLNKKYKSSNLLSSSNSNNKVYFYNNDEIPLNSSKQYTFRLLDQNGNSYYCKSGIVVTLTFTE